MSTAGYRFGLETMNASKIRSKFKDTDVASFAVTVNGQTVANIAKELGDISGGNCSIGIQPAVVVPDNASVTFSYLILNSGYDRSSESTVKGVMNSLSDRAAKLCTGIFGYAEVWNKLNQFTHWLNDLQFINCDGAVAADAIELSASTLSS